MSAATDQPSSARHAAQMDANYAFQRHVYDLTRKYYLLGRDHLIEGMNVPEGGHVLEVGCGTARNLIKAVDLFPTANFHGLDISEEMLRTARRQLEKATVRQFTLSAGDAEQFDPVALFGRPTFDRVMFSYTLSMIPGWERALDQACGLLAPDGEIHLVDFGQQNELPRWFGRGLHAWLARFHVTPRARLFQTCEMLAERHGLTIRTASLYRDYARAAVLRQA